MMPIADLPVVGRKFTGPFAYANGTQTFPVTIADIAKSALLCGHMPPGVFFPFPGFRGHAATWRTSAIKAHLAINAKTSSVVTTPEFALLETTEKAFVSWMIGSALTHWAMQNRLSVPVLLHLRQYGLAFGVTFDGKKRPDFVAPISPTEWAVVEAKGRSRVTAALFTGAKAQTEAIETVDGRVPALTVVSVASIHKDGIHVELEDPPAQRIRLEASARSVVAEYYATVLQMLTNADSMPIAGERFEVATVPELDLQVGLAASRRNMLLDLESNDVLDRMLRPHEVASQRNFADPRAPRVGPDGVVVILGDSWARNVG